jgi:hypothetical protein
MCYGLNPGAPHGPGTNVVTVGPWPVLGEGVTTICPSFSGGPGGNISRPTPAVLLHLQALS